MFTTGKIKGDVCIPFFGTVAIAKMIQYPTEKLHVGIGIGISVLKAEYGASRFARYIVQYALYIVPIKYPCYHSRFLVFIVSISSSISSLAFSISRSRFAFGLVIFL